MSEGAAAPGSLCREVDLAGNEAECVDVVARGLVRAVEPSIVVALLPPSLGDLVVTGAGFEMGRRTPAAEVTWGDGLDF